MDQYGISKKRRVSLLPLLQCFTSPLYFFRSGNRASARGITLKEWYRQAFGRKRLERTFSGLGSAKINLDTLGKPQYASELEQFIRNVFNILFKKTIQNESVLIFPNTMFLENCEENQRAFAEVLYISNSPTQLHLCPGLKKCNIACSLFYIMTDTSNGCYYRCFCWGKILPSFLSSSSLLYLHNFLPANIS